MGLTKNTSNTTLADRVVNDSDNLDQIEDLTTIFRQGVIAAIGAAGTEGRIYYATDTFQYFWDNGAAWVCIGIRANTEGSIAYVDSNGRWMLLGPGDSGKVLVTKGAGNPPDWESAADPPDIQDQLDTIGSTDDDLLQRGAAEWEPVTIDDVLDGAYDPEVGDTIVRGEGGWETAPIGSQGATGPTQMTIIIDGGESEILTGIKADVQVMKARVIKKVSMLADQSGSIVINIWKDSYANFPPTVDDKITASAPPTISSATKSEDATLTDWTKSISAGDILRFNVDSCTTITRCTLTIELEAPEA